MNKRFVTVALATACTLGVALAQEQAAPQDQAAPHDGPMRGAGRRMAPDPERQIEMMTKRLKLSDDQASQIKPLLQDRLQQLQAVREDKSTDPQDRMAKARSIQDDADVKIKAILNDEQKTKYDQMEQQMRDRMRQRWQQRNGGAGPDSANQ